MSDATLRQLERDAVNDPLARVRVARSLERLGRPEEALAALVPSIDSPDTRTEIVRFAGARTVTCGDMNYVDAAPVLGKPTVNWRTPVTTTPSVSLVASELGVVVLSAFETVALDPRTGRVRWRAGSDCSGQQRPRAWICGSVLLVVTPGGTVARDLWTGKEVFRIPRGETLVALADGVAVLRNGSTVTARSFTDPTRLPAKLWAATFPEISTVAAGGTLVVVAYGDRLVCMDSTSGLVSWKAPGREPLVDGPGAASQPSASTVSSSGGSRPRSWPTTSWLWRRSVGGSLRSSGEGVATTSYAWLIQGA